MKQISALLVLFILLFTSCNKGQTASEDGLNWESNLEQAIDQAKKENKAVLVNFTGSDWCSWCIRLSSEVFQQKDFEEYAKKSLILVMLDFPRNIKQSSETQAYNRSLAQKYGIQGFPTILIFNSEGKLAGQTGYLPGGPNKYIANIQSYL
ncbi:MAG: thioredoxin family protein [Ignavibacteriales bacterium]